MKQQLAAVFEQHLAVNPDCPIARQLDVIVGKQSCILIADPHALNGRPEAQHGR